MTAEIVILNANGVALAADSAVTVGGEKIYNSAIKLFSLSKHFPVGAMIYGNAALTTVPWETLIKVFRERLGKTSHASLEEYGNSFVDFLKTNQAALFSPAIQDNWFSSNGHMVLNTIGRNLDKAVEAEIAQKGPIQADWVESKLAEIADELIKNFKALELAPGYTHSQEKQFAKKHRARIDPLIVNIFNADNLGTKTKTKLREAVAYSVTRLVFGPAHSGLVIAGFGEAEIFPSVVSYQIDGVFDGKIKVSTHKAKCYKVLSGDQCSIMPFAQDEMVMTFMRGINPRVRDHYRNAITQVVDGLLKTFPQGGQVTTNIVDALTRDVSALIQREQIDPVLNMVRSLPKDELAKMADTLVNLSAFRQRITNSLETVGGPIDVAVISKGDGLVWVRRKHYFPAELNHHFFDKYFK